MTDQETNVLANALNVVINTTLGSGLDAEIVETLFNDLVFDDENTTPENVTDQQLIGALNDYLGDDLANMRLTALPSNYVVTRATQRSTGLTTFVVGPKPEYGEASYPTELPDDATHGQLFKPAIAIDNQTDADAYLEILIKYTARKFGCAWCDAESMIKQDLGYFAGYYNAETAERVNRLFNTQHPVFA